VLEVVGLPLTPYEFCLAHILLHDHLEVMSSWKILGHLPPVPKMKPISNLLFSGGVDLNLVSTIATSFVDDVDSVFATL
jgi:hypothetical protein